MTVTAFLRVLEQPLKETAKESTYGLYAQLQIIQKCMYVVYQADNTIYHLYFDLPCTSSL